MNVFFVKFAASVSGVPCTRDTCCPWNIGEYAHLLAPRNAVSPVALQVLLRLLITNTQSPKRSD